MAKEESPKLKQCQGLVQEKKRKSKEEGVDRVVDNGFSEQLREVNEKTKKKTKRQKKDEDLITMPKEENMRSKHCREFDDVKKKRKSKEEISDGVEENGFSEQPREVNEERKKKTKRENEKVNDQDLIAMSKEENGMSKHCRKFNDGKKKKKRERNQEEEKDEDHIGMVKQENCKFKLCQESEKEKIKDEKGGGEEDGKSFFPTVSIAIAGSIIDNAQSLQLATLLAGQIARAATIFQIDEVIVFDSEVASNQDSALASPEITESGASFLMSILRYLETPQYLRRSYFPMCNNLKYVGLLPPLDAPHHVRKHEWSPYREGITLAGNQSNSEGTLVNVGLNKNVMVEQVIEPRVRVTVAMGADRSQEADFPKKIVPASSPREKMGLYWGYKVRYASSISSVFRESPYKSGYDYIIGTSEHGRIVNSSDLDLPKFRHLLIAFGGLGGLEESIEEDGNLTEVKDVKTVFNDYLNTCPNQGSRTIRSEEAVFICLQYFQEPIARASQRFKKL
ncbi:hypothetical protein ZOSMA_252G00230 [Zostera marina]|uniref:RNA methyltransferase n=1 Tax=Zostera marina TaxID=29655 RepID=A0A0K9PI41_ZOSMR|nr:hypothetical protein ZOSMA_252G00230 [Zostera marina]